MKLLIIYHAGLAEDGRDIFREYVRQGIDLTVIVPFGFVSPTGRSFSYDSKDRHEGYRVLPVHFTTGFDFFALYKAIKKVRPDVIHVFDEYSSIYLTETIVCRNILFGKKVPVFAYAFQNIPFAAPPLVKEFSPRFFKRIIYKACWPVIFWYHKKNVGGVSGSNSEALSNIKKMHPDIATKLIFWAVNTGNFSVLDSADCRGKIGISGQVKTAGYVGRFVKEKGIDTLIEAARMLGDWDVLLVGGGNHEKELKKLAASLHLESRVHFFNDISRPDLKDYYNSFDVFVLASRTIPEWKEQYGRVLVEAMACGLPIVGSSSGAIGEVLKGYPKALIFSEGDAGDLAQKIEKAKNLQFPADFNLAEFLKKFSVGNFVSENIKFYNHG